MQTDRGSLWQRQFLPIIIAGIVGIAVIGLVYGEILLLNHFAHADIHPLIHLPDILIGLTIYLKTSIDFALLMGNLMHSNPGWRNRIGIELGTALGNTFGTIFVLFLWALFKEIDWLLALMIFIAAIVLLRLAEDGLVHAIYGDREYAPWFRRTVHFFSVLLKHLNWFMRPLLDRVFPDLKMDAGPRQGFWRLLTFSISVPFVLGLDNFAGYVPLFSIVNVFSFATGAFAGQALLSIFLYLSPAHTTRIVRHPVISLLGSVVFIGLAGWGFFEAIQLIA